MARNAFPLDREGHGTFVAGLVAESTNNGFGLTGLAYGVSIMPVRILAADGTGDAATISQGIRYAATHGAQVINLSLEFSLDVTSSDIPDIISAIGFAHRRGRGRGRRLGQRGRAPGGLSRPRAGRDLGRRDDQGPLPGQLLQRGRRIWISSLPAEEPTRRC